MLRFFIKTKVNRDREFYSNIVYLNLNIINVKIY